MRSDSDPAQHRLRLLAELPTADPRVLGRCQGRVAWLAFGKTTLAVSVAARQIAGLARPIGDAAAAREALALLGTAQAEPLGVLQCHRIGDEESPGIEGRVKALQAAALAPGVPALGGTVEAHPVWSALMQTHAFAAGLARGPAPEESGCELPPLSEGVETSVVLGEIPPDMPEDGVEAALRRLLADPAMADPSPLCGPSPAGRAALVELPGAALALAAADAAAWARLDPFWGAAHAVATAARRVVCTGAEPMAVMAAFALGPEGDAQDWALRQSLSGLRQACLALELPLAALDAAPCPPEASSAPLASPAVAVLGVIEDHAGFSDLQGSEKRLALSGRHSCGKGWRAPFDAIYLLGETQGQPGGSVRQGRAGALPELRLDAELRLHRCLCEGIGLGLIRSARDVAEGGLLGAAVDASLAGGLACQLLLRQEGLRRDALLFGEAPGCILVSVSAAGESALGTLCRAHRVPSCKVGVAGGSRLSVAADGFPLMDADLAELEAWREGALAPWFG